MRTLFLGHAWPEPTSSAAGGRVVRLLRVLREAGWPVTFACAAARGERAFPIEDLGVRVAEITLNCSTFDAFVASEAPELVIFERFMTEEQFGWRVEDAAPGALRVLDTVDLHFLRAARRVAAREGRAVAEVDLRGELARREVAAIHRVDLALLLSSVEQDLLQDSFAVPVGQLHHLPFLLDLDAPLPAPPPFEERQGFVALGTFRHPPNQDSVRWMHEAIWPAIRARLPGATLRIYGAYPPAKMTRLDDPATGFRVLGFAEDALSVMASARVCLAPLRFGAGLKGKLVDAMLAGTPSVTTPTGCEGLGEAATWPGAVAGDPTALASAAVALHEDPGAWEAAARRARELPRERLDRTEHGPRFLARLGELASDLEAARRANFTGAMLRHHRHRATEFMSRWIEAKRNQPQASASTDPVSGFTT